ncbi:MAG: site-2 protease family protein [Oscillospiraceae bacterium]|nr:site-2 protease family protein [Oscillospiraceae bacterium]
MNLGVFNLLPFPALDGGRLVFLLIELVRGKPVDQKYEMWVNGAGMLILFAFMIFVTFSDITRLF